MSQGASEVARIAAEYERRARDVPGDYYSLSRPANLLMHGQTLRACIGMLARASMFPPQGRRILDVGCGYGGWLLEMMKWGADPHLLSGIDLSRERIDCARGRVPQADLRNGSASQLPWPDET